MEVSGQPSRFGRFTPGNEPWFPLSRRLGGPQIRSEPSGEQKNLLRLPAFQTRTLQPVPQSLQATNYAILATDPCEVPTEIARPSFCMIEVTQPLNGFS
jgi:hypothetical protein